MGKKDRVLGPLERFIISKPRDESRSRTVLHPSEMIKEEFWCHRTSYFLLQGYVPETEAANHGLTRSLIFEEGHRIHDKWQTWFKEMDRLKGMWECEHCKQKFWGLHSEALQQCQGPFKYKEVPLVYEPLKIAGHSDGWLVNFGEPLLLEIKSVGLGTIRWEQPELFFDYKGDFEKLWSEIKHPFMSHVKQVQVYLKLMELIGFEDAPQEAVIIYESKATQKVKEFIVPKSDLGISELFQHAEKIVKAIEQQTPPECNLGGGNWCEQCKEFEYVINQVRN